MAKHIWVPVKTVDGEDWAQLSLLADHHLVCAESVKTKDQNFTFAGQHRVRLLSLKKNVHWKVPTGTNIDVADVSPAAGPPPRRDLRR